MALSRTGPRKSVFVVDANNSERRMKLSEDDGEKKLSTSDYTDDYDDDDSDLADTATSLLAETDCFNRETVSFPEKADNGMADDVDDDDDSEGGLYNMLTSNLFSYSSAFIVLLVIFCIF